MAAAEVGLDSQREMMNTFQLLWGMFWRAVLWLLLLGTLLGLALAIALPGEGYYLPDWLVFGILGGTIGLFLGVVEGLLIGLMTRFYFFYPLADPHVYRRTATIASAILCFVSTILGLAWWLGSLLGSIAEGSVRLLISMLILVVGETVCGVWTGRRLANWYLEERRS